MIIDTSSSAISQFLIAQSFMDAGKPVPLKHIQGFCQSAKWSYSFAMMYKNGRFLAGEPAMARDKTIAAQYLNDYIAQYFPQSFNAVVQVFYAENPDLELWFEQEKIVAQHMDLELLFGLGAKFAIRTYGGLKVFNGKDVLTTLLQLQEFSDKQELLDNSSVKDALARYQATQHANVQKAAPPASDFTL